MSEVVPLFSSPLYISNIKDVDFSSILRYAEEIEYAVPVKDTGVYISNEVYLIDKLPELKQSITNHVNIYLNDILELEKSFKIYFPDSWFVKVLPQGHSEFYHFHSNSLYSGVVYIDVEPNGGSIEFFTNITGFNSSINLNLPVKRPNIYNSEKFTFKPESGEILLFPSSVYHRVNHNNSDKNRYSFSFNILPEDYRCNINSARILDR
jgi:uncharacterized protein (TIGR02466 family)